MKSEKISRFSLRKLSIGLVSAAVGSVFISFSSHSGMVYAEDKMSIDYKYVSEDELTEEEKALVIKELPKEVKQSDKAYYLVYRPLTQKEKTLPETGSQGQSMLLTGAAVSLLVVGIVVGKSGKKKVAAIFLVTSLGTTMVSPTVLAISNQLLAEYNQKLQVSVNEQLPEPLKIPDYQYVGYIKEEKSISLKEKPAIPSADTSAAKREQTRVVNDTVVESLAYATEYKETLDLKKGQERVVQYGKNGTLTTVYKVTLQNGKEVKREVVGQPQRIEPINQIIEKGIGTSSVGSGVTEEALPKADLTVQEETVTETIPYETEQIETPLLKAGKERVKQEGVNGSIQKTYRITFVNGVEAKREMVGQSQRVEPIKRILEKGTGTSSVGSGVIEEALPKADLTVREETVTETIPYETERIETPLLKAGEERVKQEGVNGSIQKTYRITILNGVEAKRELLEDNRVEATNQIVEIGTGTSSVGTSVTEDNLPEAELTVREETVTETIPYETEQIETPLLKAGEERVKQEGINGSVQKIYRITLIDGVEAKREMVGQSQRVEPIKRILEKGTGTSSVGTGVTEDLPKAEIEKISEKETLAFETQEEQALDLPVGKTEVKQEGVNGTLTTTYEIIRINGVETSRQIVGEEERIKPTPRIIRKGTVVLDTLQSLVAEVDNVKALDTYQYDIARDKQAYDQAIDSSKQLLNQEKMTQEAVDAAIENINRAKQALNGFKTDKLALRAEYDLQEGILPSILYTKSSPELKEAYTNQLATVRAILDNVQSTQDEINQALQALIQKREALNGKKDKPLLEVSRFTKDENKKTVSVSYALQDEDQTYVDAKAQLYQGDTLIKEVPIAQINELLNFDELQYFTNYTLKTSVAYDLGDGRVEEVQTNQEDFILEYKKIEIKDIESAVLYGKDKDKYRRYITLGSKPENLSNYFVKIKTENLKEMLLPVHAIEEVVKDGKPVYEVTVKTDELVQEKDGIYEENYTFYVNKEVSVPNVYTSFKQLIDAMNSNLSGNFVIGENMTADEVTLDPSATSYVAGEFTGKLTGEHDGKAFAIYDLVRPLFNLLKGATVTALDLKEVAIDTDQTDVGALAKTTVISTISDVSVSGRVKGKRNVAGLIYNAAGGTKITNSSFEGTVVNNNKEQEASNTAGLVGVLHGRNALIQSSKANAHLFMEGVNNAQRAGILAGQVLTGAIVEKSYAEGMVNNSGDNGFVGGLIGTAWDGGIIRNVVSSAKAPSGNLVRAENNYNNANIKDIYLVENEAEGKAYNGSTMITKEAAQSKIAEYNITTTLNNSRMQYGDANQVNYVQLNQAQEDRRMAYENVEKLLPFYNKEYIVQQGNKVDLSSKLAKVALVDIVPMIGNDIVLDVQANQSAINRLMLHYSDTTVEYVDVTFKEAFKNNQVVEYNLVGTSLVYTPETFVSSYTAVIDSVLPDLSSVTFDSETIRDALGIQENDTEKLTDYLYLENTFNDVKDNLPSTIRKVLAWDKTINSLGDSTDQYIIQKIKQNPAAFLLGLSYLQRWYNINYGDTNIQDLSNFKFDFFGNTNTSTLDTIIALGKSGYNVLLPRNNVTTFNQLAVEKGTSTLFDYLEGYRALFLKEKSNNEWLKENSKAYIVETFSGIEEVNKKQQAAYGKRGNQYSVGVYDRLAGTPAYKNMLLPLLTLSEESLYVMSNMSTIGFGGYERYAFENGDKSFTQYVRDKVDQASIWQRDYLDFWYKMVDESIKDKMFKTLPVYDGFSYKTGPNRTAWKTLLDKDKSIQEFFGPINKFYRSNGSGAYATGSLVHYVVDRALDEYGSSVYTHEMTHNFDGTIFLNGYGRREGMGAESFALGLLQAPSAINGGVLGINTMFTKDKTIDRLHTVTPVERFNTVDDLNEYVHGMFDVIYTLDYAEAQATLKQTTDMKKKWLRKLENQHITDRDGNQTHALNKFRALTDEEVNALTDWQSLIDNDIINRRGYYDERTLSGNGYYTVSMLSPIYSAISNPKGAPGDLMFRRMAYELLAAKGYNDGFIPYTSNKFGAEALRNGQKTWSNWFGRYVGVVTDDMVFEKIFNGEYASWADFKKAMYQERIDKLAHLKPITIQFELGDPRSTKEVTITSYEQMQTMIEQAMALDATNIDRAVSHAPASWVHFLKQKLYSAFIKSTDDFKTSIFNP